jgi:hypothetical protein
MIVVVFLLVLVAALAAWSGRPEDVDAWVRNDVLDLARTPIERLADGMGLVRVTGRVRPIDGTVEAPVTARRCLAFVVSLYESGRRPMSERLSGGRPFLVEDDTGSVLVDPGAGFVMALVDGHYVGVGEVSLSRERQAELWSAFKIPDNYRHSCFYDGLNLWREDVLVEGTIVSVAGHVGVEVHPSGESEGPRQLPTRLVVRGQPLLVADHVSG